MSINFKIFFQKTLDQQENIVLLRGNLLNFDWNSLREKIIENSHSSYFQSNNLMLNKNDKFSLELTEKFQNLDISQISSIYNDVTFSLLLEKLKAYKEKNPDEKLALKFSLEKKENLPVSNIDKYEICLKESLKKFWKKEKEKIKNELNEIELTNSEIIFLNRNLKNNNNQINNINTICNNCLSINFFGFRYICSYCNNYNLCYQCYKTYNHNKEHNFILFKQPIIVDDINKYDNKISPCSQIFKNIKESFKVNFNIANTGEKDLRNCYITYIKFDKNFLYCKKYIFDDKFENNESKKITLTIYFNVKDNIDINFNIFEGDFRMFNKQGIPFGDILKIKVINTYVCILNS